MMLTESEAKQRWCPFARVTNPWNRPGFNRYEDAGGHQSSTTEAACIGSACMAWRWAESIGGEIVWTEVVNNGTVYAKPTGLKHEAPTQGYCGLAGKPRTTSSSFPDCSAA